MIGICRSRLPARGRSAQTSAGEAPAMTPNCRRCAAPSGSPPHELRLVAAATNAIDRLLSSGHRARRGISPYATVQDARTRSRQPRPRRSRGVLTCRKVGRFARRERRPPGASPAGHQRTVTPRTCTRGHTLGSVSVSHSLRAHCRSVGPPVRICRESEDRYWSREGRFQEVVRLIPSSKRGVPDHRRPFNAVSDG